MHVQFKIHGSGKKSLHGDGIALWYTKDRLHSGNTGSSLRRSGWCGGASYKVWIYPEFSAATKLRPKKAKCRY